MPRKPAPPAPPTPDLSLPQVLNTINAHFAQSNVQDPIQKKEQEKAQTALGLAVSIVDWNKGTFPGTSATTFLNLLYVGYTVPAVHYLKGISDTLTWVGHPGAKRFREVQTNISNLLLHRVVDTQTTDSAPASTPEQNAAADEWFRSNKK